jgi:hypothetical protein
MNGGCVWITLISTNTAEGSLRAPTHWLSHWLYGLLRPTLFPWLLLKLPLDRSQGRRPNQESVNHPLWSMCLHNHILQVEDCRSHLSAGHPIMPNLEETFNSLRKFQWKLNPTKCIFGMPQGKLIGFCCRSKPTGEQWQATQGAGRLLGLLVGLGPLVNGPGSSTRPGV